MTKLPANALPYTLAALGGFLVCLSISLITGSKEAWDNSAYFSVGIPLMCVMIFFIAYHFPVRAWRWTLAMALGQAVALLMSGNSLNLWPLAIIAMTILSLPQLLTGIIASYFGRKRLAS